MLGGGAPPQVAALKHPAESAQTEPSERLFLWTRRESGRRTEAKKKEPARRAEARAETPRSSAVNGTCAYVMEGGGGGAAAAKRERERQIDQEERLL